MRSGPWQSDLRTLLARWHATGVRAVDPAASTSRAMRANPMPDAPPALLAMGKAAVEMLAGATVVLRESGVEPASTLVITDTPTEMPGTVPVLLGDHPLPGARSAIAAAAIAEWIDGLPPSIPVLVLLSGGTSALVAAPLPGISPGHLHDAFDLLHRLGLDIVTTNAARRQLTRWSGGRLRTALGTRPVSCYLLSDVLTEELAAIGSGPLIGGALASGSLNRRVVNGPAWPQFPADVQRALAAPPPATARPTPHIVVASGPSMLHDLASASSDAGLKLLLAPDPLTGTAASGARVICDAITDRIDDPEWDLLGWAGELTVALNDSRGLGGRCQELAVELAVLLAAAAADGAAVGEIMVLAAGTDGRDGPTDAAGAYASAHLAAALRAAGFEPEALLRAHDTHKALDRVGALYRTGPTGTNVADLILVGRAAALTRHSIPRHG